LKLRENHSEHARIVVYCEYGTNVLGFLFLNCSSPVSLTHDVSNMHANEQKFITLQHFYEKNTV